MIFFKVRIYLSTNWCAIFYSRTVMFIWLSLVWSNFVSANFTIFCHLNHSAMLSAWGRKRSQGISNEREANEYISSKLKYVILIILISEMNGVDWVRRCCGCWATRRRSSPPTRSGSLHFWLWPPTDSTIWPSTTLSRPPVLIHLRSKYEVWKVDHLWATNTFRCPQSFTVSKYLRVVRGGGQWFYDSKSPSNEERNNEKRGIDNFYVWPTTRQFRLLFQHG